MAIGMKLWFKKLAMNQTSWSNQRNEMINRRVSVMLCDCFDIWNTLVSFLVRQCLLLYCQVHISLSWLPSKKFSSLCNSALNSCSESFCQGVKQLRQRSYNSVRCKRGQGFTSYTVNRNDALQTVKVKRFSTYCWENKDQTNQNG